MGTPCNIVEVTPGVPQVTNMLKIDMAAAVRWELRVCNLDIDFEVHFAPAQQPKELIVVHRSAPQQSLTAAAGVVDGVWNAPGPGTLSCRFSCDSARRATRTKIRVCLCRAQIDCSNSAA